MSTPRVKDKIGLGQLIIEATIDDDLRRRLLEDANAVLAEFVEIPENHTLKVVPQEKNVTTMMLPLADDVSLNAASAEALPLSYPGEYDPQSPDFIDPAKAPEKALKFRIGDYILARCR